MRDLPFDDDDEFSGHPAYPAGPPPEWERRPEIFQEPGDADDYAAGSTKGSFPAVGRGPARRRGPGRAGRRLAIYAAVIVPALAAGVGIALVKVAGDGSANVALAGNSANAVPSVGVSVSAPAGTSPSASVGASASTSPPSSTGTSLGAGASVSARPPAGPGSPVSGGTNMGVQVGTGESGPGTLAGVLGAANTSVEGKGLLPPARCGHYQQNASGAIVCTAPVPGVAQVFYQNYSSLTALYDAYKAEVAELDGGTFRQNTRTCGNSAVSYAEFGWNQEEGHPHDFTVAQMASGKVGQIFASGRMACFTTRTPHGVSQDIVWTIDNGPAMGVAIGSGSPRPVYQLWGSLHHAVLFRGTEMCGTAPRMNLRDIPTGNLKVLPACPAGVEAVPASPPA